MIKWSNKEDYTQIQILSFDLKKFLLEANALVSAAQRRKHKPRA